jgi:hypothetical protein
MIGLDVQITFPQSHNPIAISIIILDLQRFARKATFPARRLLENTIYTPTQTKLTRTSPHHYNVETWDCTAGSVRTSRRLHSYGPSDASTSPSRATASNDHQVMRCHPSQSSRANAIYSVPPRPAHDLCCAPSLLSHLDCLMCRKLQGQGYNSDAATILHPDQPLWPGTTRSRQRRPPFPPATDANLLRWFSARNSDRSAPPQDASYSGGVVLPRRWLLHVVQCGKWGGKITVDSCR